MNDALSGLLDLLGTVRLVLVIHAPTKKGGRPRADWQLEQMDASVARLFRGLVPIRPPFVYTDGSA